LHLLLLRVSTSVFRFFRRLGVVGLLLMSTLDSSFLVLPFGNDVLLIALVSSEQTRLSWIGYVIVSAIGSVIGVLTVDLVMRKTGEKGLTRFVSRQRIEQLKEKMDSKAGLTVFIATLMPPPFPFTPVVMTAAALQCPRAKLLGAVFAGRIIRFTIEALLALYFGRKLIRYINSDVFVYFVYALILIAVLASGITVFKWINQRKQLA